MTDTLQFGLRIGGASNPAESDSTPSSAVQKISVEALKGREFDPSQSHNSSPWFIERRPRGVSAHSPEQTASQIPVRNTRGCNASNLNEQRSGAEIPRERSGLSCHGGCVRGVSRLPIRPTFSVARWVRLPLPIGEGDKKAATMSERFESQAQKERG